MDRLVHHHPPQKKDSLEVKIGGGGGRGWELYEGLRGIGVQSYGIGLQLLPGVFG